MGVESCNISDNQYLDQNFDIPEELKNNISWESRAELIDCWLDTLIVSKSDILKGKIKNQFGASILLGFHESNLSLLSINLTDPEFGLRNTLEQIIQNLSSKEFFLISQHQLQAVVIGGVSYNYSQYLSQREIGMTRRQYFETIYGELGNNFGEYFNNISLDERNYLKSQIGEVDFSNPNSFQSVFEELGIVNTVTKSLRPQERTSYIQWLGQYKEQVEWENEKNAEGVRIHNQFELLESEGFSSEVIQFIAEDMFPRVCGDSIECGPEVIERLKILCLFIIDIETESGINLRNGERDGKQTLSESQRSSASGYFHMLNQHGRIDTDGDGYINYNTIDTNLRYAADLYNTGVVSVPTPEHEYKLREVENIDLNSVPEAQWVVDLWRYNEGGRDAIEFTFDDQVKMFLIRTMFEDEGALRGILLGNNVAESAADIYKAHHTGVDQDNNTQDRLNIFLEKYY